MQIIQKAISLLSGDLTYDNRAEARKLLQEYVANGPVSSANGKWWKDIDFVFDGIPATGYSFPVDRIACLLDEVNNYLVVPVVPLTKSLDDELKDVIRAYKKQVSPGSMHIHVVTYHINDSVVNNMVGMFIYKQKCQVATDFSAKMIQKP
jgi:hypothetical protein